LLQLVRVLVLIGALLLVAAGLFGGLLGAVAGVGSPAGSGLMIVTASLSFLAVTGVLGSGLAWHAWRAVQGRGSLPFRPRWIGFLILLLVLAVYLGSLVLSNDLLPLMLLPPLHVAGATLPPLIVLALVGRSLSGATRWRDIVLHLSSGAFLSTTLAIVMEIAVVVSLVLAVLLVVAIQPGGLDRLQVLAQRLQDPAWLQDPAGAAAAVRTPIVVAALLLVLGGITPAIEEAVKALGVPLLAYRRPCLAQAFLWGVAGGAGFALFESLFNSLLGLGEWVNSMIIRIPTSVLHCFTGGLVGMAWYAILHQRRWLRGLGLYVGAVAIHGAWNAVSVGASLLEMAGAGKKPSDMMSAPGGIPLPLSATLFLLFVGVAIGLMLVTRSVRKHSESTPDAEANGPLSTGRAAGAETADV